MMMRELSLIAFAFLQAVPDKPIDIRPANLPQSSDSGAWDHALSQQLVGIGATDPEELGQLLGAHQVFG
jgi:hypothetical protein